MSEVAAAPSYQNALLRGGAWHFKPLKQSLKWEFNVLRVEKKLRLMKVGAQMVNPSTYSSRIATDIALVETPGVCIMYVYMHDFGFWILGFNFNLFLEFELGMQASFDQYLEDKPRVFKAIFPDKRRSQQLNEEEWRVHMLPIEFLFLTVFPVIDMRLRCKSSGTEFPSGVPRDISKVLELDIIRWELRGLDDMLKPSQFTLGVKGALYPDRRGSRSRLKGQLQMSISFVLPPVLSLVPEDVRRDVAESVLKRLVENMKDKVNSSLIADYSEYKREKPKALA
ncbi:hypothetical protein BUALT_Bualt04G0142400 [Buddleja alternifolia]|uniref:Uncharacterized protein n=1 Tax=Buddleja alternifolia TaxID=168488 RepID=A0AAV6XVA5_9LAMI|nr:hypothetical protein BUALT_Bualt04G0142400 [Buddleja alternifolia]